MAAFGGSDRPHLFDRGGPPHELTTLPVAPAQAARLAQFTPAAGARGDMAAYAAAGRESQARRWVVYEALRNGSYYPWDYQPLQKASERYMRNHMDLNVLEESARFPRGE